MNRHTASGISMIEILIAIVVLAVGMLGVASLQGLAIQNNAVSGQYTVAALQVQSLVERMRANRLGVQANAYDLAAGSTPPSPQVDCGTKNCDPEQAAAWDLTRWHAEVTGKDADFGNGSVRALPSAVLSVSCVDTPCGDLSPRSVTLCWDPDRGAGDGAGTNCFATAVTP